VDCAWDPNASWRPLQAGEATDVSTAYGEIMTRCPVARVPIPGAEWPRLGLTSRPLRFM
jgi:hypothetical protein